jgi:flagellar hook-length control protein FliK
LRETVEQRLQGEGGGRRKPETAQRAREAGTLQEQQERVQADPQRAARQPMERTSESHENRETVLGANAARSSQSAGRGALQTAEAQRAPLGNEQFEALINNARIVVRDSRNGSFTMNLYPETLGRVNVNLGLEDGVIVGRFLVDSREAREAMMENLESVRQQLQEAGIQVGGFQVNVRGERERLVRELQEASLHPARGTAAEAQHDYEIHAYRRHDGALDVIA